MKYLFFDLDGTLTEPYEGITKSVIYALASYGIPRPDETTLRACIGPPLYAYFSDCFGMSAEESVRAVEKFRERYHAIGWKENALIAGVAESLERLAASGKILAVATGKPTVFAEKILSRFKIRSLFSAVVGSGLDGSLTEKREELARAMELVGAPAGESAMIGDRKFDVEGGRACGVFTAGVRCGYAEEGELERAGADVIFDDFRQLTEYFLPK